MDAAPVPDVPDNSKAEPIAFSDTFIVNERYEVECPHCHAHKISFQSKVPGDKAFACPRCKGPLKAFVKQKTKPPLILRSLSAGSLCCSANICSIRISLCAKDVIS